HGRVVLVGVPTKSARKPSLYTLPLHFDKVLVGSEGGRSRPDRDIPRLVRLYQAEKVSFDKLVGKRYALNQINDAIDDLRSGAVAGRGIIRLDGSYPSKNRATSSATSSRSAIF